LIKRGKYNSQLNEYDAEKRRRYKHEVGEFLFKFILVKTIKLSHPCEEHCISLFPTSVLPLDVVFSLFLFVCACDDRKDVSSKFRSLDFTNDISKMYPRTYVFSN